MVALEMQAVWRDRSVEELCGVRDAPVPVVPGAVVKTRTTLASNREGWP